ncbi:MAG: hypothetical protein CSB48_02270 [Proteobacteria bacterium]|nr:MAG: hypothetical protein CSB48_02270 [Pseudomonadota bacterium]
MPDSEQIMEVDWPAPACVKAVQTLRNSGPDLTGYSGFNLAFHVGDDTSRVANNRADLASRIRLPASDIMWLNQVHSNRLVEWQSGATIDADGCYTHLGKKACAVMTADCLPVLICNSAGTRVAAVHCGWRGLAGGILQNALAAFAADDNLLVWLGPAISVRHFEVGGDVYQAFASQSDRFDLAFRRVEGGAASGTEQKWMADLCEIARIILSQEGVDSVYGGLHCTFSEPERFYSYRRDRVTGRMATLIWIDLS